MKKTYNFIVGVLLALSMLVSFAAPATAETSDSDTAFYVSTGAALTVISDGIIVPVGITIAMLTAPETYPANCSKKSVYTQMKAAHADNPSGYNFTVSKCELDNSGGTLVAVK